MYLRTGPVRPYFIQDNLRRLTFQYLQVEDNQYALSDRKRLDDNDRRPSVESASRRDDRKLRWTALIRLDTAEAICTKS